MKRYYMLSGGLILLSCSCLKKEASTTANFIQQRENIQNEMVVEGIVSHEFLTKGCSTIIKTTKDHKVFIPFQTLPKEFDVDKLFIIFTYKISKRMQAQGCEGVPIVIKSIVKK
jgi:hypothetical protein